MTPLDLEAIKERAHGEGRTEDQWRDDCWYLIAEVERLREEVSLSVELREKVEAGLTAEVERLREAQGVRHLLTLRDEAEVERMREAIVHHRHNVWGDDAVTHDDDRRLYAVLSPDTKEEE